mgnify:CR=1 FL=1
MALVKLNARSATALDATVLTGNLPAISGASLTGIDGGKIKQIIHSSVSGQHSTTSENWRFTNASATITLTSTSNDVLYFVQLGSEYHSTNSGGWTRLYYKETGSAESAGGETLTGWSQVAQSNKYQAYQGGSDLNSGQGALIGKETRISNTNAHTFQVLFRNRAANGTYYLRHTDDPTTTITLMEIAP